jgi:hypothetical protein
MVFNRYVTNAQGVLNFAALRFWAEREGLRRGRLSRDARKAGSFGRWKGLPGSPNDVMSRVLRYPQPIRKAYA